MRESTGYAWCAALVAALSACQTPQVAYNPRANFSAVKRVAVVTFAGPQGEVASDLMTQRLVGHGADVIERSQLGAVLSEQHLAASGLLDPTTIKKVGKILGVDALFIGTVVQSQPAQSYVVTTSRRNLVTAVTPVSGSGVYSEGPVLGVPNSQVITTAATVSLVSRMVDVETGSVLWSASMTYEGFDVASAMDGIAEGFVHSLVPIWPEVSPPK